ncbi:MAG: pyridoxamine 5'-phosphate oxidase family protein [Geminicoccaceae bacterium]
MDAFNRIETEEKLRSIMGLPGELAANKVIDRIDEHCRRFIETSPFLVLTTRAADGHLDLSPKGDPHGFVAVLDEKTLALPDRLGNNRTDSLSNLLHDPHAGLIFMVPGRTETLRVAGTAIITDDQKLRERLAHQGKPPKLVIVVRMERAYFHCAKCMIRSDLWRPENWPQTDDFPSLGRVVRDHAAASLTTAEADARIEEDERERLY